MPGPVKVTIEVDVDPGEETALVVKPFGTAFAEPNQFVSTTPKQTRTLTEKGTGTDRSPDASDNDYD